METGKIVVPGVTLVSEVGGPSKSSFYRVTYEVEASVAVSDGVYTFGDLYEQRDLLFLLVMSLVGDIPTWKSRLDPRGNSVLGCFVAGIDFPGCPVWMMLPDCYWGMCVGVQRAIAPYGDEVCSDLSAGRLEVVLARIRQEPSFPS